MSSVTSNKCVTTCEGYTGKDNSSTSAQKCVNCSTISKVRYLGGDTCIDTPTGTFPVPISSTDGIDYGIIDTCHTNCESCTSKGDDNDNKCTLCTLGKYKEENICLSTCSTSKLYQDEINRKCINCQISSTFKYDGLTNACITPQPDGTIVTDTTYNIIEDCYTTCSTCSAPNSSSSSTNQNCLSCKTGYLINGNCLDQCDDIYYQDSSLKECINCKTKHSLVKYLGRNNQCISIPSTPYYTINNDAGVIADCGTSCLTCSTSPITGDDKCDSCSSNLYLNYPNKNCVSSCSTLYAISSDGKSCIKCSENTDITKRFKYEDGTTCISRPDNSVQPTYIVDGTTDIIKNCHSSCASCSTGPSADGLIHNCLTCKSGTLIGTNCISTCSNPKEGYNTATNSCVNCKTITKVKYEDNDLCTDIPTTPFYYVDKDYGVIKDCHTTCASCNTGPNSDLSIHNCLSCSGSLYLNGVNCVSDCGSLVKGSNNKCINCKTNNEYKLGDTCQSNKDGYYITDPTYNISAPCDTN